MGVFQILFIVMNVALPFWLWSKTSNGPMDWGTFEKNLTQIVQHHGGFPPCAPKQAVEIFRKLCEMSRKKFNEPNSTVMEQANRDLVFSCEYKKTALTVRWYPEPNEKLEAGCSQTPGDKVENAAGFTFGVTGRMQTLDFINAEGERESVSFLNCRAKANLTGSIRTPPADLGAFLQTLGQAPHDPPSYQRANQMCYIFDTSPLWKPWRERYSR